MRRSCRSRLALASTRQVAEDAAACVGPEFIAYEDLPAILTLEEAIERRARVDPPKGFPPTRSTTATSW